MPEMPRDTPEDSPSEPTSVEVSPGKSNSLEPQFTAEPPLHTRALKIIIKYIGLIFIGVVGAVAAALGPDAWAWIQGLWTDDYRISVQANTDELVTDKLPTGLSYITTKNPATLPAPPNHSNNCLGRYAWSRSNQVQGIDGDLTALRVTVNAIGKNVEVNGASVYLREQQQPIKNAVLLTCPGQGGPPIVNSLRLELGTDNKPVFIPKGGEEPTDLLLTIPRGANAPINVTAFAPSCDCTWLLEAAATARQQY